MTQKYKGADKPVLVLRTAPMESEKQKNVVELLPRPLLPQISIMWSFLNTYLKKTADVYRIFPETCTILEQRIADLKDSFKLQAEGKTVDAEMVGANNILVTYLVRSTLINDRLTDEEKDELLFTLQKVGAKLAKAYGTTPAVLAVDKIDRYVVDLMFMLAESVTKAISDMSDKSWMECHMVLVAVLNVYRNQLSQLLENYHIFINAGELGGATNPSFHAHAMSQKKDEGVAHLPDENKEDETLLTKKHFERLGPRKFDGLYIKENLEEVAIENFLILVQSLLLQDYELTVNTNEKETIKRQDKWVILNNAEERDSFSLFIEGIEHISVLVKNNPGNFDDFIKEMNTPFLDKDLVYLFERYSPFFSEEPFGKGISLRKRAICFCDFMKNIQAKRRYWSRYKHRVVISPVSELFALSFMRKIGKQGVEGKIKAVIKDVIPEGLKVDFMVNDYFSFTDDENIIPAFTFTAEPYVWALYGKPIMAIAEESLNTHWEKIFYITEAYLRSEHDEHAAEEMLQKLDELFGITTTLEEMARSGIPFETTPSSLLYAGGVSGKKDINTTARNYLRYFTQCFAYARKKKILHLPGLCPRATLIKIEKDGKQLTQIIKVTPICVYLPVMELSQFEKRFGPIELMKETNARFELVSDGDKMIVVQKTGGESRTKGRPLFHRDKREMLLSRPRIDEEPLVEAISEMIKQYVFTSENLLDAQTLYFLYYMREYLAKQYTDKPEVSWKKIAEIMLFADDEIYLTDTAFNVHKALQKAFAKSQHRNVEIGKAAELIHIIIEAREEAIKKISITEQRGTKLSSQIQEGHFMKTHETLMSTIEQAKGDKTFMNSLKALQLPKNEKTHEHILYIFCVRQEERQERQKGKISRAERKNLIIDNLDTISFFKIAELIVEEAFYSIRQERIRLSAQEGLDKKSIIRDSEISDYLLVEFMSRVIYKYVSESPKLRKEYREAVKYYYDGHTFFEDLQKHIAEELVHKSHQSKEYWKALGGHTTEGHVQLIEKCILPAEKVATCVVSYDKYGRAMDKVMSVIEKNLKSFE